MYEPIMDEEGFGRDLGVSHGDDEPSQGRPKVNASNC